MEAANRFLINRFSKSLKFDCHKLWGITQAKILLDITAHYHTYQRRCNLPFSLHNVSHYNLREFVVVVKSQKISASHQLT